MNDWEEFDAGATYQKKHVDPEMRRWILTRDCRRAISDRFFNNPTRNQGLCNLILKNLTDWVAFSRSVGVLLRQLHPEKVSYTTLQIHL